MSSNCPLLAHLLPEHPDIRSRLSQVITPERTFNVFKTIADTYAPTLTACQTRGPVLRKLFSEFLRQEDNVGKVRFESNYLGTGAVVLALGDSVQAPVWSVAHLDNISFLTGNYQNGRYPVTPYCQSRQNPGQRPAVALALDAPNTPARICAKGTLVTAPGPANSLEPFHFFETPMSELPLATRVCYATEATWDTDTGMVYGAIDNAACCTALVLATMVVGALEPNVLVIFPDEEEGVVDVGPQTFSRAATRLVQRTSPQHLPDLVIVSDIQDLEFEPSVDPRSPQTFGHGASMEAFTSRTRGAVTPPYLLSALRQIVGILSEWDIHVREMGRYLNRSDDVSMLKATPNIAHIGCPGAFTHFQETPRVHVEDMMHLAKTLAVLWLVAQSPDWRASFI